LRQGDLLNHQPILKMQNPAAVQPDFLLARDALANWRAAKPWPVHRAFTKQMRWNLK
jgi:hypothetical protein